MKVDEVQIPQELYSQFLDDCVVFYLQKLDNYSIEEYSEQKLVYKGKERRLGFVIETLPNELKVLQIGSKSHSSVYDVEIHLGNSISYVWCNKESTTPLSYEFPKKVKGEKEFLRDEDGNLILDTFNIEEVPNSTLPQEIIDEIHSKYEHYLEVQNSSLEEDAGEFLFWNLRDDENESIDRLLSRLDGSNIYFDGSTVSKVPNEKLKNKFSVSNEQVRNHDLKTKEEILDFMKEVDGDFVVFFADKDNIWGGEYSVITSNEEKARQACEKYHQDGYAYFDEEGKYKGTKDKDGKKID